MRVFPRIAALAVLAITFSGCAGVPDRRTVLNDLDPAPMTERDWAQVRGTYVGPVRASTVREGFEAASSMEVRLDLSGSAADPGVTLHFDKGISTEWAFYSERKGTFTNVPSKRYGSQGMVFASTHAPNHLLLELRRYGIPVNTGYWLILTFRGHGAIEVDFIGHSGWRGDGELWRVPALLMTP